MPEVTNNYGIVGAVTAQQVAVGKHARAIATPEQTRTPALIPIGDIDSFQAVRDVPPERVRDLPYPLQVPEATIKRLLARILAEPFVPNDHGGEMDDLFSQVRLNGRESPASFLLKGPGLKPRGAFNGLTPAGLLGVNGDQIERMMTQPAELFVVQYVGGIAHSVHQRLRDAITAGGRRQPPRHRQHLGRRGHRPPPDRLRLPQPRHRHASTGSR